MRRRFVRQRIEPAFPKEIAGDVRAFRWIAVDRTIITAGGDGTFVDEIPRTPARQRKTLRTNAQTSAEAPLIFGEQERRRNILIGIPLPGKGLQAVPLPPVLQQRQEIRATGERIAPSEDRERTVVPRRREHMVDICLGLPPDIRPINDVLSPVDDARIADQFTLIVDVDLEIGRDIHDPIERLVVTGDNN
ncbi:hypothetical protein [Rhizobium jaguaris]|uniref:hypothetical protein n=1 Tax=Rhizobium jaguaris TaxID=1312183 RepID=UPI0013C40B4A|nr:hypothetical protein [Rhizobium jaguaris]